MNASISLLRQVVPATVHVRATIPEQHPSAPILGVERMGTATVVEPGDLIVTAHYLLIGAERLEVTLLDGTAREARVAGIDFASGLGIARLTSDHLPAGLELRPVEQVRPGEDVFVVASTAEGRRVNDGVVSSIGPFEAFWEYMLDKAITVTASNPGFGGGPLIDTSGKLIGVVSLSIAEIGKFTLAIPASYVGSMLVPTGPGRSTGLPVRPWVGLTCYTLRNHVIIASLLPGSPAEQAGLKSGDVVLAIDAKQVADRRSLYAELWCRKPGDPVRITVFRNNRTREIEIQTVSAEAFFS